MTTVSPLVPFPRPALILRRQARRMSNGSPRRCAPRD